MCVLEAGAKGYITKGCSSSMLVEAVTKAAQGGYYVEPKLAHKMNMQAFIKDIGPTALNELSTREFAIFYLLAKGFTLRETADQLRLAYKTAWNRTTSIKTKLNARNTAEMAHIAHEHGLFRD